MKKIITTLSIVTLLAACGTDSAPTQNPELLKGLKFQTVLESVPITLAFDSEETTVFGKVVNNYRGMYEAVENKITFGPVASTMMMGPESAMRVEQDYHTFLGNVRTYELKGQTLTFTDKEGKTISFEKID